MASLCMLRQLACSLHTHEATTSVKFSKTGAMQQVTKEKPELWLRFRKITKSKSAYSSANMFRLFFFLLFLPFYLPGFIFPTTPFILHLLPETRHRPTCYSANLNPEPLPARLCRPSCPTPTPPCKTINTALGGLIIGCRSQLLFAGGIFCS